MENVTKTDLSKAIFQGNYKMIVNLAAQHHSKKNSFSFCEQLKEIKEDEIKKVMAQLFKMLVDYAKKSLFDQNLHLNWSILNSQQCESIVQFMKATTDISVACIECNYTSLVKVELAEIAVFLNVIMLPLPENMDYVKNFISHYCEKLISSTDFNESEVFFTNVVLYLVQKTLTKEDNINAVKRLYGISKILIKVLEQDGPLIAQLWSLFVDCAVSDVYLESIEGIKVIALVMSIKQVTCCKIHDKIKLHLSSTPVKNATSYGKIYFEAWNYTLKAGNKYMQDVLEVVCIRQLILMGIQPKQIHNFPIIQQVLNQFIIKKYDTEVSKMLHSVYQPTIWKYIKNSNPFHRACAAQLFFDLFPLEDPNVGIVENDKAVNDQLLIIKNYLCDPSKQVKVTAILGICVSMSVNWEVFPEESLKTYIRIIVNDLSRDSTFEVRVAVVKGLIFLLENPLAVGSVVHVIPKLHHMTSDSSKSVRIAFCQLLKKISTTKKLQC